MTAAAGSSAPVDDDADFDVFEALASPRRREILRLVWDRERAAGEIHRSIRGVTFGAVSQHLAVLHDAGLVARRDEGRFRYYAARRGDLGHLGKWLEQMWDGALADLKRLAESEENDTDVPRTGKPRPRAVPGNRPRRRD